jgi:hypothetical protein
MKKILALAIYCLSIFNVVGQDTITSQDLPNAGGIYVLSIGSSFTGMDVTSTGANHNWDFSQLTKTGQRIDTMKTTQDTDPLLSFFFINNQFNTNRANHATRGNGFNLGFVNVSDVFNYYYNSTSEYRQPGFGAVMTGLPLPIAYSPHDVIYRFPLNYSDEDSVAFSYEVDLSAAVGLYFKVKKKRRNLVDGWGSLTTPYGTFDVLRVKSVVVEQDSIYVDSLNLGLNLPAVTTIEYKWLGKGHGLPLLQINTSGANAVTQILYQDSIDFSAISELPVMVEEPVVFPNPASEKVFIKYKLNARSDMQFTLIGTDGKVIFENSEKNIPPGENVKMIELTNFDLPVGNYLLNVGNGKTKKSAPLLIID